MGILVDSKVGKCDSMKDSEGVGSVGNRRVVYLFTPFVTFLIRNREIESHERSYMPMEFFVPHPPFFWSACMGVWRHSSL